LTSALQRPLDKPHKPLIPIFLGFLPNRMRQGAGKAGWIQLLQLYRFTKVEIDADQFSAHN
jgi:hypothetical protein